MIRARGIAVICAGVVMSGCGAAGDRGARATSATTPPPASASTSDQSADNQAWVDPTYTPNRTVLAALAIAPVPLAGDQAQQIDQGMERVFLETPGSQLRGQPAIIRDRMNGNRQFVAVIDRIRSARYATADLPTASLTQLLTPKELIDLRTSLNMSSMLLMPIEFAIEPRGGTTGGHVFYRVYSLESGDLLLQNRLQKHIAAAAEAGHREMTIQLILALQQDFATRLMP